MTTHYPTDEYIKQRLAELSQIINAESSNNTEAIKEYNALVDLLIGNKSRWKYLWKDPKWAEWKSKHHSQVMKGLWDTVWVHRRTKPTEEEQIPLEESLPIEDYTEMVDEDGFSSLVPREEILGRLLEGWLLECDEIVLSFGEDIKRIDLSEERLLGCDEVKDLMEKGWALN